MQQCVRLSTWSACDCAEAYHAPTETIIVSLAQSSLEFGNPWKGAGRRAAHQTHFRVELVRLGTGRRSIMPAGLHHFSGGLAGSPMIFKYCCASDGTQKSSIRSCLGSHRKRSLVSTKGLV